MNGELISFNDLKLWTGFERPTAVKHWLDKMRVKYHTDKEGNPIAIRTNLVRALGEDDEEIDFDM